MKDLPLSGVTVLEFSQYLAGPYAGLRLADLGARVIKIERPQCGDACRQLATKNMTLDGDSLVFHTVNRNKESYAADLKNPDDLERVKQLIAQADVMTHNFRPGVMEKIGLDFEQVININPNIVYGEVSGYGKEGPWVKKPGQDLLAQALSGLTWLSGSQTDGPTPFGMAVGDMICGTHFAQGLLAALIRRAKTGVGARVEVSLLESLVDFQFEALTAELNKPKSQPAYQRAQTDEHAHALLGAPYGIFATQDARIALAMGSLEQLAHAIELPELNQYVDENFAHRDRINELLRARLSSRTTEFWLNKLRGIDFWCSPVFNYAELMHEKGFKDLAMKQTVKRSNGSEVTTLRCPIRLNNTRLFSETAAPMLGQDNTHIDASLNKATTASTQAAPQSSNNPALPLDGITVLDFSQFLSGPSASLRMADLGARVIKVEQPGTGDIARTLYSPNTDINGTSAFFCAINRNKESVSLDLKDPKQRDKFEHLVRKANVVLHNFRPEVAARLGIDETSIKAINPQAIYGEISGYGKEGDWASLPGQDLLLQSISGMSWLSGNDHHGPTPMGLPVVDIFSGAQLAQGVLALLYQQTTQGISGSAEVIMLESALDFQFEPLTIYFQDGGQQPLRTQTNNAHSLLGAPYGVYQCQEGYLAIAMADINQLAELLSCHTLAEFSSPASWFERRNEIKQRLAQHLKQEPATHWLAILEPADVWCAHVYDWPQLRASQAYQCLDLEQYVENSDGQRFLTTRCPIRLDSRVLKSTQGTPTLGEHNQQLRPNHE